MILVLAGDGHADTVAALETAFGSEGVTVVLPGAAVRTGRSPATRQAPARSSPPQPFARRRRLVDQTRSRARELADRPLFGPLRRVVEQAAVEAKQMAAPIAEGIRQEGGSILDGVLGLLDNDPAAAVVCLGTAGERLGWRVAQARPDRLVIAGGETSSTILKMIDEAGVRRRPSSAREVLNAIDVPVGTYPFPELRRAGRPRVVSLVSNSVDGDSRVQKVAMALADLGYESILVGRHPEDERDHYLLGQALVERIPIPLRSYAWEREAPPRTPSTALAFRAQGQVVSARRHARAQARRLSADRAAGRATQAQVHLDGARRWITGFRAVLHAKNRQRFFSLRGDVSIETAGQWRRPMVGEFDLWALADDLELGFGPYVESLHPDVIHAHDADMLSVAMTTAERLRDAGRPTRVVYDAHEYTPGTARFHSRQSQVLSAVEREFVPRCDAVFTVSDEIAQLLAAEHGLTRRPAVVLNAPTSPRGSHRRGVRPQVGLSSEIPLLVYVGGVAPQRGVDLAVAALPHIPEAHLAVVAPESARTARLEALATSLGVAKRFHRLDYVPPDQVVDFISSCDIGLIPFRPLPNSELGIPTKFREYLVAGLPIVASDQGLVGDAVRRTGIGEVFESGNVLDLAAAVNSVLEGISGYRAAISVDLVEENLWAKQAAVIERVYAGLATPGTPTGQIVPSDPAVLIGRTNTAGQASAWARSLRCHGVSATSMQVMAENAGFAFDADISVRLDDWQRFNYRLRAFVDLVPRHSHALIEYGIPMFDTSINPLGDVDSLARSGLQVALVFHGSDVRRPARHMAKEPWSPFSDPHNGPLVAKLHRRTSRLHAALAGFDGPMFVSTPDLLDDVAWAEWLPVVVDTDRFVPDARDLASRDRPVVLHVPSRGAMKGTGFIVPILQSLHGERVIEYRQIDGVPHSMMASLVRSADIVVDQLLLNGIGVAAAEAMASGRVVVAHLDDEIASRYPVRPPVVDATPDTLEQVLRGLAADGHRRAELGRLGREFALAVHDGRLSAKVLIKSLKLDVAASL